MPSRSYQDLVVWKKAMRYVEAIYAVTRTFPSDELYGLTSQLRRAAVSVPSNIAEGQGRGTKPELIRACRIAVGSLYETETQLYLAHRFGYVPMEQLKTLLLAAKDVGKLLHGLMRSLEP